MKEKHILISLLGLATIFTISNATILDDEVKNVLLTTKYEKAFNTELKDFIGVKLKDGNVIYIYRPDQLVFVGEILTKTGVSLTELHRNNTDKYNNDENNIKSTNTDNVAKVDLKDLFKYSLDYNTNPKNKYGFLIFDDPECPFCKMANQYLKEANADIKHILYPLDGLHQNSRLDSINIIKKEKNLNNEEAVFFLNNGIELANNNFSIQGTPKIIVYEKATNKIIKEIDGFNKQLLSKYIENKD